MTDSVFHRALVYLCEHNQQGAMGLIVNKPSGVLLAQLFDQLKINLTHHEIATEAIHLGGPVQPDRGFVLHQPADAWQTSLLVDDDIALTTSRDILDALAHGKGPERHIVALGYAGWEAGQLENELAQNSWLTIPASAEILFNCPAEARYETAIQHLGFDLRFLSSEVGHA